MITKPKQKRAPSQLVKCDICGKQVYGRGLKSHMRLQHKLQYKKITQVVPLPVLPVTQVKANSDDEVMPFTSVKAGSTINDYYNKSVKCPVCGREVSDDDLSRAQRFFGMPVWDPDQTFCRNCGYFADGSKLSI